MVGIPRKPDVVREESYVKIYNQKVVDLPFHELMELSNVIDDFLKEKEAEREQRRRAERLIRLENLRKMAQEDAKDAIRYSTTFLTGVKIVEGLKDGTFAMDYVQGPIPYATIMWNHDPKTAIPVKNVKIEFEEKPIHVFHFAPTPKRVKEVKAEWPAGEGTYWIEVTCDPEYDDYILALPGVIRIDKTGRENNGTITVWFDHRYKGEELVQAIEGLHILKS